ncbi:MAG: HlyD family efflux transporter periplasmic adaptor subunit [Burkholderiales bacterium]
MPCSRPAHAVSLLAVAALAACSKPESPALAGYVEADFVRISAPVGGVLRHLAVARGVPVSQGGELFRLETEVEAAAQAEASARVAQTRAQAVNLRKGKRQDELRAVEAQLAQARATAAASKRQLVRERDLAAMGFIAPSVVDDAEAMAARDAARVRELEAQLAVARDAARPDEIAAAEAQARAAAAALDQQSWRVDQKRQSAPVAGLVFDVLYRVGERVPANSPVVTLLPPDALKVRFYVPQSELAALKVGTAVTLGCDGCSAPLRASVTFVSPQAEYTPPVIYSNESRQKLVFLVEARPDAETMRVLKPGQPLDVVVAGGPRK